ncbi:hypothetical protein R1flu_022160 [Riccia fluitans]|uniref:Uncharacterized protein n=1 Tax=Riccia fluitans TaxID=41844 RepID=A0ABD1ZRG3_9MARC
MSTVANGEPLILGTRANVARFFDVRLTPQEQGRLMLLLRESHDGWSTDGRSNSAEMNWKGLGMAVASCAADLVASGVCVLFRAVIHRRNVAT